MSDHDQREDFTTARDVPDAPASAAPAPAPEAPAEEVPIERPRRGYRPNTRIGQLTRNMSAETQDTIGSMSLGLENFARVFSTIFLAFSSRVSHMGFMPDWLAKRFEAHKGGDLRASEYSMADVHTSRAVFADRTIKQQYEYEYGRRGGQQEQPAAANPLGLSKQDLTGSWDKAQVNGGFTAQGETGIAPGAGRGSVLNLDSAIKAGR